MKDNRKALMNNKGSPRDAYEWQADPAGSPDDT